MALSKFQLDNLIAFEPVEIEDIAFIDQRICKNQPILSINGMIREIIRCKNAYEALEAKPAMNEKIESLRKSFKEQYAILNTDPPRDIDKLETKNLLHFLNMIEEWFTCKKENISLDEEDLKEGHKIILEEVHLKEGKTKAGHLSEKLKYTTYKGEKYWYQCPEGPDGMAREFTRIIKQFNRCLQTTLSKKVDQVEQQLCIFRISSWFLFEILDLHPFSDANGRLFRAICSFYLSFPFGPFPCPVYKACREGAQDHVGCEFPCKDDYEQALVDARKSKPRHPSKLCTIMIYCCWDSWRRFLHKLNEQ